MAEDPEELKRNIEQSRRDVDALTDKVSPGRVAGRRVDRARGGMHRLKENVMGSAVSTVQDTGSEVGEAVGSAPDVARAQTRGTPLAAGLIAFAAGWVVVAAFPVSTRERDVGQATKDKAMEAAGPVKEQAVQVAQEMKETSKSRRSRLSRMSSNPAGDGRADGRTAVGRRERGRSVVFLRRTAGRAAGSRSQIGPIS